MKKIKIILMMMFILLLTGCFNNNSMENINIITSVYPIQYIVNTLYGNHSTVNSIYPLDANIDDFEVTNVLLENYSNNDLFIFNGLTDEKKYVKELKKNNKDLKIIDLASNMTYDYSYEELWLNPSNLLTIANNIKKGFNEYIDSTYLTNEINENYENLKIELTKLDGRYYSVAKNSNNPTIIVSDDAFKFLEKYEINVISLDKNTRTDLDIENAKNLISDGTIKYIFIKYKEEVDDTIKEMNAKYLELYTMTNLSNINLNQDNYISLMNQNLENLKEELLK